jgi:hypothetical protein
MRSLIGRTLLTLIAIGWTTTASLTPALARGALVHDQDSCVLKVGPDLMYFSVYLIGDAKRKYCEDIPSPGEAIFALDFAQEEMREMKTDFRILRGAGDSDPSASLDGSTVAYLAPNTYPKGTVDLTHVFTEAGEYTGVVTVDGVNGEHWEARFPFSVGGPPESSRRILPYFLFGIAAALGTVLLLTRNRKAAR